jgi:hypothetical protein
MRLFVFRIYPIVVSDRLHLDIIGDIVVGHFLLDRVSICLINQCGRQIVVMVAAIQLRG